jgi:transcriptional regulator of acetoin/glycerol metabolism
MATPSLPPSTDRLALIESARNSVFVEKAFTTTPLDPVIERSWRRCLGLGYRPEERVSFAAVSKSATAHALEGNRPLLQAANPIMAQMAHAMAMTRYFAILTDARGVVIDTSGPIDRSDSRVNNIARIGVDLSEEAVGTTAIGAALADHQPVWLHRGEHFFADTAIYSCAGAPLFGPQGQCIGMLDLTGVDVPERPELKHLVEQSARSIENALLLQQPFALLLRLNWPGRELSMDTDGLITLDAEGFVSGSNGVARHLIHLPVTRNAGSVHCSDLFAMPWQMVFDSARPSNGMPIEAPLWSGLRVRLLALASVDQPAPVAKTEKTLRVAESDLIRLTLAKTKGNVAEAARILGISRATIYRKLTDH